MRTTDWMHGLALGGLMVTGLPACSDDAGDAAEDTAGTGESEAGGASDGSATGDSASGSSGDAGGSGGSSGGTGDSGGDGDGDGDGDVTPPEEVCTPPIGLADVSSPDTVVTSCDEAGLRSAVEQGGVIVFDCGSEPVTITLTATLEVPTDRDTVLDGGGLVTLDGGDTVRILSFYNENYRQNESRLTLQRLTFQNGRAPLGEFTPDPGDGCAWGYRDGEGAAVLVRDGRLDVIDCVFRGNHAAPSGPDTGGGGIYAAGSLGVTIVGSAFIDNEGSNSGAVGFLQTDGGIYNTRFENNRALGTGQNRRQEGCPFFNHDEQGGGGGNGGAMAIDGADDVEQLFCGVEFLNNSANELGGAVFRTPNGMQRPTTFRQCTMDGNQGGGGGSLYISNSLFTLEDSTVSNNTAEGLGGGVRTELETELNLTNVTFHGNETTAGLGGALSHSGGGGTIRNCTFANNRAEGGEEFFTAAIRGETATITNSIFENNTTVTPWNPAQCWFTPHPGQDNFQWPRLRGDSDQEDTACVENITWESAELGPLQDNGGPTRTTMPAAATVIGGGSACPATDQRGVPRPETGCTAGAVEAN